MPEAKPEFRLGLPQSNEARVTADALIPAGRSAKGQAQWPSGRRGQVAPTFAALAVLFFLASLSVAHFGLWDDVTWLIDLAGRMLDGQRPYVDFFEASPPLAILAYVPPTAFARALGLSAAAATSGFVLAGAAASLAFSAWLLHESGRMAEVGAVGLLAAAAALLVLPSSAFAQRDHVALIAALPFFTLIAVRVGGGDVGTRSAIMAGLGAAPMVAIRPHYVLAFALPTVYLAARRGVLAPLRLPEVVAAGAALALVGAATLAFFPAYVSDMVPMAMATYAPIRGPLSALILTAPFLNWATFVFVFFACRRSALADPFAVVPFVASAGAMAAYIIQGKGFPYHAYVGVALMVISLGMALRKRGTPWPPATTIVACFAAASLAAGLAAGVPGDLRRTEYVVSLLLADVVVFAPLFLNKSGTARSPWAVFTAAVALLTFGQAEAAYQSYWMKAPYFLDEARRLKPHPTLALISGKQMLGQFLAARIGARWAHRVFSLNTTENVAWILENRNLDAATRAQLEAYRQRDRDMLLEDLEREKPDAIIVDVRFASAMFDAPTMAAILADYRLADSAIRDDSDDKGGLLRFYVRVTERRMSGAKGSG
jgi:hypothetical protein